MKIPLKQQHAPPPLVSSSGGIGGSSGNQTIKNPTVKQTKHPYHKQTNSGKKPQSAAPYGFSCENSAVQSLNTSKEKQRSGTVKSPPVQAHLTGKITKQAYKKPQIHLQLESELMRAQTPIAVPASHGEHLGSNTKHNYTQVGLKGHHSLLFGGNRAPPTAKGLHSPPHLAQYVSSMPNSAKHSTPHHQ
jgi:hypothetical protein